MPGLTTNQLGLGVRPMATAILKKCIHCACEKPHSDFYSRGSGKFRADCKSCTDKRALAYAAKNYATIREYKKRWRGENAGKIKEAKRVRYVANAKDVKLRAAEYARANPERVKAYKQAWKKDNPQALREYRFVRGQAKRQATPSWANRAAMLAIYHEARQLSKDTGVEHHVDHVVPILSSRVCGLHCQQNMQILAAFANQSKLNRWWPDMWEPE